MNRSIGIQIHPPIKWKPIVVSVTLLLSNGRSVVETYTTTEEAIQATKLYMTKFPRASKIYIEDNLLNKITVWLKQTDNVWAYTEYFVKHISVEV